MSWMDIHTSLYKCQADNSGRAATYGDILLTQFGMPHDWYCETTPGSGDWVNGRSNDLDTIIELRNLDRSATNYKTKKAELKARLQGYTPAALLETKKKGMVKEINRTGLMQLDFDYNDISEYDIEELKRCVFSLPFVCFCGLSCSGDGFYALAMISEPERLFEYAEHCFAVLLSYGLKADTSKGKKPENLRYLSYDSNMLVKDNPEPLRIKKFYTNPEPRKIFSSNQPVRNYTSNNNLVQAGLSKIQSAQTGHRWQTVQQVAYTLGGLNDQSLIYELKSAIESNPEFNGEEIKYCKCAEDCFAAGSLKPLNKMQTT